MSVQLSFDEHARKEVLGFFGKEINNEGIIVESDTKEPVIGVDGDDVHEQAFAGIKKGSEIFLKKDLVSMMRLAEETK